VVSVGNIVAGGTGKTPFVIMAAEAFAHRRVAILSRGYGKVPDEAMLLRRRLPQARVYVGKNRAALAQVAAADGAELILLDDGFQHRKLARDFDLVLLRGDDPFGKGHYLPQGFLRDSPKRLAKADAVFATERDFRHKVRRLLDEEEKEVGDVRGWKMGLFTGIGNPASFKKSVEGLGVEVALEWLLADHEGAKGSRLKRFSEQCKALGVRALITTEKDFIKGPKATLPIIFIESEIEWIEGKIWEKTFAKIDHEIDNRHLCRVQ
jgi:tetraacyldisaccharide 4'-kinase